MDNYTNQANQLKEKLMPIFPKVKDYKKVELENRETSGLAYVSMNQNGQGTSKLRVEFDKETGKLHGFTFYEPSGSDKEGDYQYQTLTGTTKPITDDQAKEQAIQLLKTLYGTEASNYQVVSVWRESDRNIQGKLRPPIVNLKSSLKENKSMATYASIYFTDSGEINSYETVIKPTFFDKWYVADIDKREKQRDILSKPAQVTFDNLKAIYPSLVKAPIIDVNYDYEERAFLVNFRQKIDQQFGDLGVATFKIDKNSGKLASLTYYRPSNKAPTPEVAKAKST
ncbi:hypothetical protein AYJ08_00725 [Brevibacillus sp. SKDU10]|uniref:hypothetical protein n=1 Tax=Brevibacillus sp. SKDU10 TaxID=1247872 RepID=UPI0007D7487C|nr:hypothetical protein [Brevibacillus sp. SKDU10]OAJ73836.1 hypothetical protein AYJ08_00725 [Brevibacillus sp. SKDU10]